MAAAMVTWLIAAQGPVTAWHFGRLHALEGALALLLAVLPFLVLGVVLGMRGRRQAGTQADLDQLPLGPGHRDRSRR